jgi:hypothetical protein
MDLEAVVQQFEEGKNYFVAKAKELSQLQGAFSKRVAEINLCEWGNSSEDNDGNDDLLKINFGGEKMDIKRSALTKSNFGWNLFSCLFEKRRWDGFHVRDREGRIYVDLKGKWLKPLIYCFHQNDVNADIISPNLFTNRAVEMFNRSEFIFQGSQILSTFYCKPDTQMRKLPHTLRKSSKRSLIIAISC